MKRKEAKDSRPDMRLRSIDKRRADEEVFVCVCVCVYIHLKQIKSDTLRQRQTHPAVSRDPKKTLCMCAVQLTEVLKIGSFRPGDGKLHE